MIKKIILAGCLLSLGAQLDAREVPDNVLGGAVVVVVLGTVGAAKLIKTYRKKVADGDKYNYQAYKELREAKETVDKLQKEKAALEEVRLKDYELREDSLQESKKTETKLQEEKAALEEKLRECEVHQRKYFARLGKHGSA